MISEDTIVLDKELFERWSRQCYFASAKGISFRKLMEQANKLLFAPAQLNKTENK